MDPLAHTLVGATLAETSLRRVTPLATATLVIGANLPDIDGLMNWVGRDAALLHRRGWTHGALAMVVLPLVLAGAVLIYDRWIRRRRQPDATSAQWRPILGLAYLSVWTHPALDWLNTYGVRLLMPFDGTWFYGDTLFIIDPWLWLLASAAVVLARSHTKLSIASWLIIGTATSALVVGTAHAPWPAKVLWMGGITVLAVHRFRSGAAPSTARLAQILMALLIAYIASMLAGTHIARNQMAVWLEDHDRSYQQIMAGPLPANPFARDVIVVSDEQYRFFRIDWLAGSRIQESDAPLPIRRPDAVIEAARSDPRV